MSTYYYVVTTSGNDDFYFMTLLSVFSGLQNCKEFKAFVLLDTESFKKCIGSELSELATLVKVDTPNGNFSFKNRWIKTQLPEFVDAEYGIFVDSDTIFLENLSRLSAGHPFGGVLNHNNAPTVGTISHQDLEFSASLGWSLNATNYVNGGVLWWKNDCEFQSLYSLWHELWLYGYNKVGRYRDQPALNKALVDTKINCEILEEENNAQIFVAPNTAKNAKLVHYYSSASTTGLITPTLISLLRDKKANQVHAILNRIKRTGNFYKNQSLLCDYLMKMDLSNPLLNKVVKSSKISKVSKKLKLY